MIKWYVKDGVWRRKIMCVWQSCVGKMVCVCEGGSSADFLFLRQRSNVICLTYGVTAERQLAERSVPGSPVAHCWPSWCCVETSKHVTSSCHCTNLQEFVDDCKRRTTKKSAPALRSQARWRCRSGKVPGGKNTEHICRWVWKQRLYKATIKRFCRTSFDLREWSKSWQGL